VEALKQKEGKERIILNATLNAKETSPNDK
jgi:hypothetical protein